MKKYVYKYNHNGKDLYYYTDDVNGDGLVSDLNDASIFSEKTLKHLDLDSVFNVGDEMFYEEENVFIKFIEKPVKIEV